MLSNLVIYRGSKKIYYFDLYTIQIFFFRYTEAQSFTFFITEDVFIINSLNELIRALQAEENTTVSSNRLKKNILP